MKSKWDETENQVDDEIEDQKMWGAVYLLTFLAAVALFCWWMAK